MTRFTIVRAVAVGDTVYQPGMEDALASSGADLRRLEALGIIAYPRASVAELMAQSAVVHAAPAISAVEPVPFVAPETPRDDIVPIGGETAPAANVDDAPAGEPIEPVEIAGTGDAGEAADGDDAAGEEDKAPEVTTTPAPKATGKKSGKRAPA